MKKLDIDKETLKIQCGVQVESKTEGWKPETQSR